MRDRQVATRYAEALLESAKEVGVMNEVAESFAGVMTVAAGNRDLFMNAVNWLRGEETLISVRPRQRKYDYRMLQPYEGRRLFWMAVVMEPGLLLALGLFVWARRQLGG